jgi:uncharacterized protein YktA (UPF0223 family)
MSIQEYLENINRRFKTGISSELTFEDIRHYQKIIAALSETERVMRDQRHRI